MSPTIAALSRWCQLTSSCTSRSDRPRPQPPSGHLPQGRQRRGTSPSVAPCARPLSPELTAAQWSLARPSSMTLHPVAQAWASFSALSSLKQLEEAGLVALGSSPPRFLMSPTTALSFPPSRPALPLPSALVNPSQGERAGNPQALLQRHDPRAI